MDTLRVLNMLYALAVEGPGFVSASQIKVVERALLVGVRDPVRLEIICRTARLTAQELVDWCRVEYARASSAYRTELQFAARDLLSFGLWPYKDDPVDDGNMLGEDGDGAADRKKMVGQMTRLLLGDEQE